MTYLKKIFLIMIIGTCASALDQNALPGIWSNGRDEFKTASITLFENGDVIIGAGFAKGLGKWMVKDGIIAISIQKDKEICYSYSDEGRGVLSPVIKGDGPLNSDFNCVSRKIPGSAKEYFREQSVDSIIYSTQRYICDIDLNPIVMLAYRGSYKVWLEKAHQGKYFYIQWGVWQPIFESMPLRKDPNIILVRVYPSCCGDYMPISTAVSVDPASYKSRTIDSYPSDSKVSQRKYLSDKDLNEYSKYISEKIIEEFTILSDNSIFMQEMIAYKIDRKESLEFLRKLLEYQNSQLEYYSGSKTDSYMVFGFE